MNKYGMVTQVVDKRIILKGQPLGHGCRLSTTHFSITCVTMPHPNEAGPRHPQFLCPNSLTYSDQIWYGNMIGLGVRS